jgi:hypothetical protein
MGRAKSFETDGVIWTFVVIHGFAPDWSLGGVSGKGAGEGSDKIIRCSSVAGWWSGKSADGMGWEGTCDL